MGKLAETSVRRGLLLATTAAAALGAIFLLPVKKALAALPQSTPAPTMVKPQVQMAPGMAKPRVQLEVIQPKSVSPTTVKLLAIAHQALSNPTLEAQIASDPNAVGKQFGLSAPELLVLRHMDHTQFSVARGDAARLVSKRLASGQAMPPGATNTGQITERMIVGRAILAAVGRDYRAAASANACCPWSKAIEVGVQGDPALYATGFR